MEPVNYPYCNVLNNYGSTEFAIEVCLMYAMDLVMKQVITRIIIFDYNKSENLIALKDYPYFKYRY